MAEKIYYGDYLSCFGKMRNVLNDYTDISLDEADAEYNKSKAALRMISVNSILIFIVIL
jgi:hypothetical protein